ncbi:MAG: hypothetical protein O0V67_05600 [Methanocorpusculum sp.]|nr:hypothetical protein [Methanocorpusculum sp.]
MKCWYHYPELADRHILLNMLRAGYSIREICDMLGCTRTNVNSAMKNHGIRRPYVEHVPEGMRKRMGL